MSATVRKIAAALLLVVGVQLWLVVGRGRLGNLPRPIVWAAILLVALLPPVNRRRRAVRSIGIAQPSPRDAAHRHDRDRHRRRRLPLLHRGSAAARLLPEDPRRAQLRDPGAHARRRAAVDGGAPGGRLVRFALRARAAGVRVDVFPGDGADARAGRVARPAVVGDAAGAGRPRRSACCIASSTEIIDGVAGLLAAMMLVALIDRSASSACGSTRRRRCCFSRCS